MHALFAATLAAGAHLSVFALIWRVAPPPPPPPARLTFVSLLSSEGQIQSRLAASEASALEVKAQSGRSEATPPPVSLASAEPSSASSMILGKTSSPPLSPPAPHLDTVLAPTPPQAPNLADLILAGPSLTAQPSPVRAQTASAPSPASPAAGDRSCRILDALQTKLRSSAEVHLAVSAIPRQSRSVANAILLWNGEWIEPASVGGAASLAAIELQVDDVVAHASPECRQELQSGPRLLTLGDANDTLVLAFGSGRWRWEDLRGGSATISAR